jgi:3-methylfumaryl-CoA hydratase
MDAIEADYADYIGRTDYARGHVDALPLEAMAAILDRSFDEISPDGSLPPLWHWLLLQKHVRRTQIGEDGHPRRGGFMPPITLPRRMFAGSRSRFLHPLFMGDAIERELKILAVTPKSGRSGRLTFVTVQQTVHGPRGPSVVEEQDIVYREAAPASKPAEAREAGPQEPAPTGYDAVETVVPDPVMLFRFSAATANSHRIHYDKTYATMVEGHPDLVIHGPLQAVLLADLCRRHWASRPLQTFTFKAIKPLYLGHAFHCGLKQSDGGADLCTLDFQGEIVIQAEAT